MSRRGNSTPGVDGLLILDKPVGLTSHDVVSGIRRLYGQRRVGHAGTLDPAATGVLLVCLGKATRLLEYLVGHDKAYTGQIVLGIETDSYDNDGTVTEQTDAASVTEDRVRAAMADLIGTIDQVPPAVSAKKVDGQPAYRLARRGLIPALPAVPVRVDSFDLLHFEPGPVALAQVEVTCGAGTYIRALAHDLGAALGVGGHLRHLVRTRVGRFTREQALTLESLGAVDASGRAALLRPLNECIAHLPSLEVPDGLHAELRDGKLLPLVAPQGTVALLDTCGQVMAIGEARADGVRPRKVLV